MVPKYALAYAGRADARSFLFRYYRDAFPEGGKSADEASRRAVELDPDSPEAHTARGTALLFNGMHVEAEKHFETAILLNPNQYEPYYFFGRDRKSVVEGKSVSVRVDLGGRRIIKKKNKYNNVITLRKVHNINDITKQYT